MTCATLCYDTVEVGNELKWSLGKKDGGKTRDSHARKHLCKAFSFLKKKTSLCNKWRIIHGCAEIPDIFRVLNVIAHE